MNIITIKVNGIEYNLKGEENEEYLQKVANYVDKKLKEIMNNNQMLSDSSAAVLTALNAADEMFKIHKDCNELKSKVRHSNQTEKLLNEQLKILTGQAENLKKQLSILEDSKLELLKKLNINDQSKLQEENKNLKFDLRTSKYKVIDLQNKLTESQIQLAKAKKNNALKL
jgi:cell division protein ZapA